MNVNPVAAPGHTSTGQIATRAVAQQASAPSSHRDGARGAPAAAQLDSNRSAASAHADHQDQALSADRQKAEQLKAYIGDENMQLRTYHDEASGRSILEVRDQTTGDVVSQYPSEELIRLYSALRQPLIDQSA